MNKKVKELIEATGAWVAICMKQYPDSRFVDDKLVRVCAALSAFEDSDETPLPCPFCGGRPKIIIHDGDDPGDVCGKIVCLNPQCPVQPEICDDRKLPGSVGRESFRSALISQWNTRPANAG